MRQKQHQASKPASDDNRKISIIHDLCFCCSFHFGKYKIVFLLLLLLQLPLSLLLLLLLCVYSSPIRKHTENMYESVMMEEKTDDDVGLCFKSLGRRKSLLLRDADAQRMHESLSRCFNVFEEASINSRVADNEI